VKSQDVALALRFRAILKAFLKSCTSVRLAVRRFVNLFEKIPNPFGIFFLSVFFGLVGFFG
jgi:hypothetical protein